MCSLIGACMSSMSCMSMSIRLGGRRVGLLLCQSAFVTQQWRDCLHHILDLDRLKLSKSQCITYHSSCSEFVAIHFHFTCNSLQVCSVDVRDCAWDLSSEGSRHYACVRHSTERVKK